MFFKKRKQEQPQAKPGCVAYKLSFKGEFLLAAIKVGICPENEDGSRDITKAAALWDELYKDFAGPFSNGLDVFKEERHSTADQQIDVKHDAGQ